MLYLDHNATTPVLPEVLSIMSEVMQYPCNSSSVHFYGRRAKVYMEEARANIASMLGLFFRKDGYNIVFTSSGTEANNLILNSVLKNQNNRVLISAIEHSSIMQFKDYYNNIDILEVDENGIIRLDLLEQWLKDNDNALISIMMANNETGVIQSIKEIAQLVHKYGGLLHSDCIQAVGKVVINLIDYDIDLISISGHKFGGPIGAAALIYKEKINLKPSIIGGGQERGVRAGTENIAAIAGMGIASKHCSKLISNNSEMRDLFEKKITELYKDLIIFSNRVERLPNTSMIAMPGISASKQLIAFDMNKIAISSGSACSSGKVKSSHILKAMGVNDELASCAVRVSFGKNNTEEDVESLVEACIKIWKNNG